MDDTPSVRGVQRWRGSGCHEIAVRRGARRLLIIVAVVSSSAAQQFEMVYTFSTARDSLNGSYCIPCGGTYAYPGTVETKTCQFMDPLPAGAVLQSVRLNRHMSTDKQFDWQTYPTVWVYLNDVALVDSVLVTNFDTSCDNDAIKTFDTPHSADGLPGYSYGGWNVITTQISGGAAYLGTVSLRLRYVLAVGVAYKSGDQRGIVNEPARDKLIATIKVPAGVPMAGHAVRFEITALPSNAAGASLGPEAGVTNASYTVYSDTTGVAEVPFRFGDKEGAYTVEARVEGSPGQSTSFQLSGEVPARTAILADGRELSSESLIPLLTEPTLKAAGYGSDGYLLGHMRGDWSVSAKGQGAGSATIEASQDGREAVLYPQSSGFIQISAKTALKGPAIKAAAVVAGVLLDADNSLVDPKTGKIEDDRDWYVPGGIPRQKASVPVPTKGPVQTVRLVVPTPASKSGSIDFQILETSYYPGIAMNWPKGAEADTSPDLYFLEGDQPVMQRTGIPFDPSGNTSLELVINDYAAWGRIRVTINVGKTKKFPPVEITVPRSNNSTNRMPDHGWFALASSSGQTYTPIPNPGLNAAADQDQFPKVEVVTATDANTNTLKYQQFGLVGDGLSNSQEFRGFVVRGNHRRLNPHHKDGFFLVATDDPVLNARTIALMDSLGLTLHQVFSTEVQANSDGTQPRVNANRSTVPGGQSAQRAVLLRTRTSQVPVFKSSATGATLPIWTWAFGATFHDGENLLELGGFDSPERSPNGTQVAEIYPKAFEKTRIYPDQAVLDEGLKSGLDLYSSFVPCVKDEPGCDRCVGIHPTCDPPDPDLPIEQQEYVWAGKDGILDSVCIAPDRCVTEYQACPDSNTKLEIERKEATFLMAQILAHEYGHAVNMYHLGELTQLPPDLENEGECGTIMTPLDLPLSESFIDIERKMMRLHENF